MKNILLVISALFLLSSCFEFEELDFIGVEGVNIEKMEKKTIAFNLGVKVLNPNGFTVNIKPSEVDVFIEDQLIGKAFLTEKVKLIRKKEDTYIVPLHIDLEDGVLLKFFKYALKDKVKVRIYGTVKGSVYGISKRVKVDETKEIDGKNFKMGMK